MDVQLSCPTNCRTSAHFLPAQGRDSTTSKLSHAFVTRSRVFRIPRAQLTATRLGLSQLCFKICPLCFLAMLQNFAYYARYYAPKYSLCLKIFARTLTTWLCSFKRDADTLALDIWPNFRASSMFPRSLLRSRSHC